MLTWIICNFLLTLSFSLLLTSNPFIIALSILLIAIIVASIFSLLISSWFAFLIYLIYVGGILIIFSYFLALTPNQPIYPSHVPILLSTFLLFLIFSLSLDIWSPSFSIKPQIASLYLYSNCPILILLTLILFLTIIIIVKLSSLSKGPLRSFISYV